MQNDWIFGNYYVGRFDLQDESFPQQNVWSQLYSQPSHQYNFPPSTIPNFNDGPLSNQQNTSFHQTDSTSVSEAPLPEKKNRMDAHSFSQNISSKTKCYVCKLLAVKAPKDQKLKVKVGYTNFLKENKVQNNQMILVFTYLFLLQSEIPKQLYSRFKDQFLAHLEGKRTELQNDLQKKKEERQALNVKLRANIDILVYMFSLEGGGLIDWQKLKKISQPLFQGRQKKRINAPLSAGKKIQQRILSQRQLDRNIKSNQALNTQCL